MGIINSITKLHLVGNSTESSTMHGSLNIKSNLMKIHPVGAELYHAGGRAEGRTDRMKLIVFFRNCGNAPKNYFVIGKGETC